MPLIPQETSDLGRLRPWLDGEETSLRESVGEIIVLKLGIIHSGVHLGKSPRGGGGQKHVGRHFGGFRGR